jgi:hypothetical protein
MPRFIDPSFHQQPWLRLNTVKDVQESFLDDLKGETEADKAIVRHF